MSVLINGSIYSWSSIEVAVGVTPVGGLFIGNVIDGIKSISYSDELTPGTEYGQGMKKRGRTMGQQKTAGSMELYKASFVKLVQALGGDGYGTVSFDVRVSYSETALGTVSDLLIGCRVSKVEDRPAEGSEPAMVALTLDVFDLKRQGASIALTSLIP